jgi:1-deoxy-D-xylulose-5-phosphate reductoisomerase
MKKKIVILGSTGSIGKSTIRILKKDYKNFEIVFLSTNKNINELSKQVNFFKVKNVLISDFKRYLEFKSKFKNKKINIYNDFNSIKKIFKKRVDYTMCSISGLAGLQPTLDAISYSKKIAIANKESIICAWNLIQKKLNKFKTEFIPVDSEHFSIWSLINQTNTKLINKIYITASGGPFLRWSKKEVDNASPSSALRHPNWSMGKKISIDSATLMNKVFEIIEAQRIFNLKKSKFKILIHEKSYVHAIVQFNNGLSKILVHDTNMEIPIFNTINNNTDKIIKSKILNLNLLNDLNLKEVKSKKFPTVKILDLIPDKISLYETILVSANDTLVEMFLKKKIKFNKIYLNLFKIINLNEFIKYKKKYPKNVNEITKLNSYVRLKTKALCI